MATPGPPASIASSSTAVENAAGSAPAVPTRPATFADPSFSSTSTFPATNTAAGALGANSAYSSLYSSPYNRFGSTYSPFGSGYGGYGTYGSSLYGGYGSSMYGGYGGMGYGTGYMPGMGMMPGMPGVDPSQTLTAQISNTTQHTFALLHSIVQTFGGFAQMLESTFMATHSSFFAMVGVIDQFAALRDVLGQVLGVFGLIRWVKGVLTGEGLVQRSTLTDEFQHFVNRPPGAPPLPANAKVEKPSKKPIIVFLLAIFGIPYLMHKIIKRLAERRLVIPGAEQQPLSLNQVQPGLTPDGRLDPSKLTFAYALYPFETTSSQELSLKKGELVAILMMADPVTGSPDTEWWRGRTRDGREGWFPKGFVEVIKKKTDVTPEEQKGAKKVD
jgi:peroxin-13